MSKRALFISFVMFLVIVLSYIFYKKNLQEDDPRNWGYDKLRDSSIVTVTNLIKLNDGLSIQKLKTYSDGISNYLYKKRNILLKKIEKYKQLSKDQIKNLINADPSSTSFGEAFSYIGKGKRYRDIVDSLKTFSQSLEKKIKIAEELHFETHRIDKVNNLRIAELIVSIFDVQPDKKITKETVLNKKQEKIRMESSKTGNFGLFDIEWGGKGIRKIFSYNIPKLPDDERKSVDIKLEFSILPDGSVSKITSLNDVDEEIEELAINSLRQWRFEPISENLSQTEQIAKIYFPIRY